MSKLTREKPVIHSCPPASCHLPLELDERSRADPPLELAPAGYHHHATCFPSCRISPQLATAAAVRQTAAFDFGGGATRRLAPASQQPGSAATAPQPPTRQPPR